MATTLDERIQQLETDIVRCEECAALFESGKMTFYSNGFAMPNDEMAAKYRGYADNFRELIVLYKERR